MRMQRYTGGAEAAKGFVLCLTQRKQQVVALVTTASGSENRCKRISALRTAAAAIRITACIDFLRSGR
jgi:hypothetical protein